VKNGLTIMTIKGIEIKLHISWLIIFALISFSLATGYLPQNFPDMNTSTYWIAGVILALFMLISVLLHELSHSIVSKNLGVDVKTITLFIFGGVAQLDNEPDTPSKELKIALAGPIMSLILFGFFLVLMYSADFLDFSPIVRGGLFYLASINLILALFNLVPAFPMDGGRVLRALIWHFKGDLTYATKISSTMGSMFGYFLIFLGLYWAISGNIFNGIWFLFIGWFIKQLSESSYQNMLRSDMFTKIHVKEFMTEDLVKIGRSISVEKAVSDYFYKYKYTCFPVVQDEEIKGIITIDNVKDIERERWEQTPVGQIMTLIEDKFVISPKCTVKTAMDKIFSNELGRVLVIKEGVLLGIISRTDILNYIRVYGKLHE